MKSEKVLMTIWSLMNRSYFQVSLLATGKGYWATQQIMITVSLHHTYYHDCRCMYVHNV